MQKFNFSIQTRSGLTVENLTIQAIDQTEAERRLRQIYRYCTILEAKVLQDSPPRSEVSDLEGVISLITGAGKKPGGL